MLSREEACIDFLLRPPAPDPGQRAASWSGIKHIFHITFFFLQNPLFRVRPWQQFNLRAQITSSPFWPTKEKDVFSFLLLLLRVAHEKGYKSATSARRHKARVGLQCGGDILALKKLIHHGPRRSIPRLEERRERKPDAGNWRPLLPESCHLRVLIVSRAGCARRKKDYSLLESGFYLRLKWEQKSKNNPNIWLTISSSATTRVMF